MKASRSWLAMASAFAVAAGMALTPSMATAATLAPVDEFADERAVILQQTNTMRSQNGLPPLRLNLALNDLAQDWSQQQARASTMSHRPNFSAMYPGGWTRAAENVAAGYAADRVVAAWANSAGHRTNMLSSATDIGIGIAANSSGRLYFTQNFARYPTAPPSAPETVERRTGADRFEVSALVSRTTFSSPLDTVYVASGLDFPDALSATSLAAREGGPLLLVAPSYLPASIATELERLQPRRIVVAGGPRSVSDGVLAQLHGYADTVDRVSGADRFAASRALARDAFAGSGATLAFIATGLGYADALAAGPAAASQNAPVVLVNGRASAVDDETLALLDELGVDEVVIVGGPATVTPEIAEHLAIAGFEVTRVSGADRFAAAASVAQTYFPHAQAAYLATGYGFADALSGGAAAGAAGIPLITTPGWCLSPSAGATMRSIGVERVTLLGGLATLQPAVAGFYLC